MRKRAKKLLIKTKLEVIPTTPFHFDSTVYKPGHFPTSDTYWVSGKRWQTILWQKKNLGLILENKGIITKPKINLHVFSEKKLTKDFLEDLKSEIIYRFNLNLDLKDFIKSFKDDSFLKPCFKNLKGMRPRFSNQTPNASL